MPELVGISPTDQLMVQNCLLEPMVSMPHTKLMAVVRGGIYKYIDVMDR